jgi:hypothetical protein
MIVQEITPQQIKRAKDLYSFNNLNNSITKGENQIFGALGEIVVFDYYQNKGFDVNFNSTYDYDMLVGGFKTEVKTKKVKTYSEIVKATVCAKNIHQKCDYYYFVQVAADMSKAWLLGYMPRGQFYREAIFKAKDDLDTDGFVFTEDCYNMNVNQLKPIK